MGADGWVPYFYSYRKEMLGDNIIYGSSLYFRKDALNDVAMSTG